MNFSPGKVIFWGIFFFLFFLFLSCRTLQILFSYSGSWGGFWGVGWGFFSSGWTFISGDCQSFNPQGKPWVPFYKCFHGENILLCCEFPTHFHFHPGWRNARGAQDAAGAGISCWSSSTPWAASFHSPNSCSAHFLSGSSASHPWLLPGSWSSVIKVTKPPCFGL